MRVKTLAMLALAVMLVGCTGKPGFGPPRASALVTAEDATRILGGAARLGTDKQGKSETAPGAHESRCEYVGADRATLVVVIERAQDEGSAQRIYTDTRSGLQAFTRVEQVGDIGDEGFVSRMPSSVNLIVRKGKVVYAMEARVAEGKPDPIEELKRTAARVASQV
jgi:hypothetical protein